MESQNFPENKKGDHKRLRKRTIRRAKVYARTVAKAVGEKDHADCIPL